MTGRLSLAGRMKLRLLIGQAHRGDPSCQTALAILTLSCEEHAESKLVRKKLHVYREEEPSAKVQYM